MVTSFLTPCFGPAQFGWFRGHESLAAQSPWPPSLLKAGYGNLRAGPKLSPPRDLPCSNWAGQFHANI